MPNELHSARVAGPVHYAIVGGSTMTLPQGPCLIEAIDERRVDVIWGNDGEHCVEVLLAEIRRAAGCGDFVVLN